MILTGGHVIDPGSGIDEPADVEIRDGKIVGVRVRGASSQAGAGEGGDTIDVSGSYVTPGLIDIHAHVYEFEPAADSYVAAVNADAHLFASGVTTVVDAGTAGWQHFADFKTRYIDRSKVRILAFLNIAAGGMVHGDSEQRMSDMHSGVAAEVALAYPDDIVGIKTAHYWTKLPWDEGHPPWASVDRAIEAGERAELPVMVDFYPRGAERSYEDLILTKLRRGDIHTHVFAQQFPIVLPDGTINPALFEARRKGVVFDLGHGAASFWFRNAVPALQAGFAPDSISTDLHMANVSGSVISLLHVMSKYLAMGMPLADLVGRSTLAPAREMGRSDLGTLKVGAPADVAVFRLREGRFGYADCGGASLEGEGRLECRLTLKEGEIVYNPDGLGLPRWASPKTT